jgi:hypothetical protein
MAQFKLWAVYTPLLEQWTRETGARMEAEVDNDEHDLEVEYFDENDARVALYGWRHFPLFAAVKYDQPFQTMVGKHEWAEYDAWIKGLNWKIDQ